jgi:hypothetical protein
MRLYFCEYFGQVHIIPQNNRILHQQSTLNNLFLFLFGGNLKLLIIAKKHRFGKSIQYGSTSSQWIGVRQGRHNI